MTYRNRTGSVDRPASREQELTITTGLPDRLQQVLDLVREQGNYGSTWKELSDRTGLHHGKVSSALTNLHRLGWVFALKQTRNRCHIYIHADYRIMQFAEDVYDEPVRTRSSVQRAALQAVAEAAAAYLNDPTLITLTDLQDSVTNWKETK